MGGMPPTPRPSRLLPYWATACVSIVRCGCAVLLWLGLAGGSLAQGTVVRYGVYQNAPKIFLGEDGQPKGIFIDLLTEVARHEGWTLQPMPCEWQACLDALALGQIDVMPDVAYTEARAQSFDFHATAALHSWSQVYARRGLQVESVQRLRGLRVAVLAGSVQERALSELLAHFGVAVQWEPVASFDAAFQAVAQGRADVAVTNHLYGNLHAATFGLTETSIQFNPVGLYFAAGKGRSPALLAAVEQHLQAWRGDASSVYFDILRRWSAPVATQPAARDVWWLLALLLLTLGGALVGMHWLRREVEHKTRHLRASEARLNTILDSVDAAIFIKDTQSRYQYVNRKVADLFGEPAEKVIGKMDADYFDAPSLATIAEHDRPVIEDGQTVRSEERLCMKGGTEARTFLAVKLPLRDPDGHIYALCGIATDLTDYRQIQAEIHQLAFYDPLTNLPNRRLILDRLRQVLATYTRNQIDGALLFVDLDNFKVLNDTLGHDMGDLLLQQMAQRLTAQVREQDMLARLGGDEFVVMLTDLHTDSQEAARRAEQVASKLLRVLRQPYDLQGRSYECTVSVGVALFSDAGGQVEDILKRADMAMYEAKAQGRNAVRFFNPQMQDHVEHRAALEADLRDALARGQLQLHYQPQLDAQGLVLGCEALLRWQHDTCGWVPPVQFIAVAESSGLILPIGQWVLQEACRQLALWSQDPARASWRIAVNVSARQFRHPDFVSDVQHALRDTGADPCLLELELTESQLLDDVDAVIAKMSVLRAHGVRFSLDDFGTGYSSLTYLKRLPIYKLKIDQSFVRDLLHDHNDAAIVRTIVALASSLDVSVIAEGVETDAQRETLAKVGCLEYQGYLFARPMPAAAFEAWASARLAGPA